MSDERTVASGERRIERIRAERGMPVRRAPVAVGALVGGALGTWVAGVPARLLAVVRDGVAAAASTAQADGAAELRSMVVQAAAACWVPLACGVAGAVLGVLAQTGGRVRWLRPWSGIRRPGRGAAPGSVGGAAWSVAVFGAAALAIGLGWPRIAAMPAMTLHAALAAASSLVLDAVLAALGACAAVAAADVAVARWRWERAARMSPEEAREELRRSEGDPALKSRRRGAARRIAGTARGKEAHARAA